MDAAIGYIAAHPEIWEVILTGGDPLVLSARRLEEMMLRLRDIQHVKIVRFHSRVPVVEPERVDDKLIAALKASGKTTYVVDIDVKNGTDIKAVIAEDGTVVSQRAD